MGRWHFSVEQKNVAYTRRDVRSRRCGALRLTGRLRRHGAASKRLRRHLEAPGFEAVPRELDWRLRNFRRFRYSLGKASAFGLFALTIAVTPANTYMFTNNSPGPLPPDATEEMMVLSPSQHFARGVLQVFLLTVLWGIATG